MTDEASLYDRQIRLWGLEAQNRYVLLLSSMSSSVHLENGSSFKISALGEVRESGNGAREEGED